eukprot:363525-Chlamydomonas_euryale.AAC.6
MHVQRRRLAGVARTTKGLWAMGAALTCHGVHLADPFKTITALGRPVQDHHCTWPTCSRPSLHLADPFKTITALGRPVQDHHCTWPTCSRPSRPPGH